ncbi:hypothetical protein [Luedemannella helvata]|uniref:hypothetical protein n=1 Tax=Luedemannella helvata TaxID=349315 RepID=UPI0031D6640A
MGVARLRRLAAEGLLAATAGRATSGERAELHGAAYHLAFPLVFTRFTRGLERQRGHYRCATSIQDLEDDCLDRFHNDVEAVVGDLLTNADTPIHNVEGWMVPRLRAATVNAHRRRRGERGALQRPRLPRWLADRLGNDPWLGDLAVALLTWVGVPTAAGTSLWPLDRWSDMRAAARGDWAGADSVAVQRDVDRVLAAMRCRPRWYADNVERPLGAKVAPVVPATVGGRDAADAPGLSLVGDDELQDCRLRELAAAAIQAIREQTARGRDIHELTAAVLLEQFGSADLSSALADPPHAVRDVDEQIPHVLADPGRLNHIVQVVLSILAEPRAAGANRVDPRAQGAVELLAGCAA